MQVLNLDSNNQGHLINQKITWILFYSKIFAEIIIIKNVDI